jgi:hypothetical protein
LFENYRYKLLEISERLQFRLGHALEVISVVIWTLAIVVGTYAQFVLPRWTGGPRPPCYFTDALIVFVECRGTFADGLAEAVLNWGWYWTWGLPWGITIPMFGLTGFPAVGFSSLVLVLPLLLAVLTAFLAIRFIVRRLRKAGE